jgi:peptidoglycan-N-acetylglucosamine deacetylase
VPGVLGSAGPTEGTLRVPGTFPLRLLRRGGPLPARLDTRGRGVRRAVPSSAEASVGRSRPRPAGARHYCILREVCAESATIAGQAGSANILGFARWPFFRMGELSAREPSRRTCKRGDELCGPGRRDTVAPPGYCPGGLASLGIQSGHRKSRLTASLGTNESGCVKVPSGKVLCMNRVIVTTSWDDGHKLDLKLARMLKHYNIKATFYISPQSTELPAAERLTAEEIRYIAEDFEIGAHTMTHPHLDRIDARTARREIIDSKEMLELITGKPVSSFCYPYGDHNEETKRLVREAGFSTARSVKRFITHSVDRMAIGTSTDTFDHRRDGMLSVLGLCGRRPWRVFGLRRWDNLAKAMFEQARERGEVFHLWGHSREIEAHNYWPRLEAFLNWLKEQRDVVFVSNADVPACPPRVLIAAPYFKPRGGGLEEYAYQIAKGLQGHRNWHVAVVASGDGDEVQMDSYQDIKVYYLPYRLKLSNTPFGLSWRRRLRRIISAERPDVILAHAPVSGMMDVVVGQTKKIPFVVTYHVASMAKGRRLPDLLVRCYESVLLPRAFRKARAIICTSAYVQRSALIAPYSYKSTVISPSADIEFFRPPLQKVSCHRVMHVGGLKAGEWHKGLDISLRVIAELKRRYSDVHLTVVGDGDKQPHYEALAAELGIVSEVEFRGRLGGERLVSAYQSADVLIMPSRQESFGMVLIEAMACGIPVVASAVEGIPDVVDDGEVGFLVEPDDVGGFASRIGKLFDDPALYIRYCENARRTAVTRRCTWPQQVERTAEVLEALI